MTRSTRFPLFDSLRALAALSIVAYHLALLLRVPVSSPLHQYTQRLNVGVPIFFLISGFLLYRPFVRAHIEARDAASLRGYGERRVLRIVPAYWVALTLLVVFGAGGSGVRGNLLPYYAFGQTYSVNTLLGGIGQAWTLCIEVVFYAFLPLWALSLRRLRISTPRLRLRAEVVGVVALFAVSVVYDAVVLAGGSEIDPARIPWLYSLPRFLDQFALGMGLAVLSVWLAERDGRRLPRPLAALDRFPGLAWLAALVLFWVLSTQHLGLQLRDIVSGLIALGLLTPAVVGQQGRGLVRRLLAHRVLLFLGTISYGIYLYHFAVLTRVERKLAGLGAPLHDVAVIVLGTVGAVVAGAVSWYLVERPAIRLAHRRLPERVSPSLGGPAIEGAAGAELATASEPAPSGTP